MVKIHFTFFEVISSLKEPCANPGNTITVKKRLLNISEWFDFIWNVEFFIGFLLSFLRYFYEFMQINPIFIESKGNKEMLEK